MVSVNENYGVYQFYGNPDWREGGSLNLEILRGGRAQAVLEI